MAATTITVSTSPVVLIGCAHRGTAESIAFLLESWQYEVEIAGTGAEALARLESPHPPSIAFLDMDLPSPGGVDVVRSLRRGKEQRRGWIVLLSRYGGREHARTALDSGCDDFLPLPVEESDLQMRMRIAERMLALAGQLQKQSAELRYQSTHDGLTGLWNREALLSLIFQETDRVQRMKTPLSLMLLDLDDFARVNHDYGYEAGDAVLAELAQRFRRHLRSYDLIGRSGANQFLLALPGCPLESALLLGERIRETILARPFAVPHQATTLTASIGVAASRGRSPLVVLHEAESALLEAKTAGRNCVRGHLPRIPVPDSLPAPQSAAGELRVG